MHGIVQDLRASLGALGTGEIPEQKPGVAGRDQMLALLYRMLIGPISEALPSSPEEPIVLIPQGPLFLLPFAALLDESGRPLIEKHALLMAPSIQTLSFLNGRRSGPAGSALVVGNPALQPVRLNPSSSSRIALPDLPFAASEAAAVGRILGAEPLLGPAATKAAVLARMPTANVIHLASHGVAGDVRGSGAPGAIVLTADGADDGLLATPEIMRLRLNADLVVLSACNTGLGNLSGDGVIGVSRAFFAAGAKNVMVSLWTIPDQTTAALMVDFYQALARGRNSALALRQAMLAIRVEHPDPLAWAGFVLMGGGNDLQAAVLPDLGAKR
jgi:CHAT domain-containing protein